MAIRKVQIIPPGGGYDDTIYPQTSADIVKVNNENFTVLKSDDVESLLYEIDQLLHLILEGLEII